MAKKTCCYVFLRNENAGLGSEVNNLLYMIYFSQKHNLTFRIFSTNWIYAYDRGWNDYFDSLDSAPTPGPTYKLLYFVFRVEKSMRRRWNIYKNPVIKKLFTSACYFIILNPLLQFGKDQYWCRAKKIFSDIPLFCRLEKENDYHAFILSMNKILEKIWIIQPDIRQEIDRKIASLGLPEDYAAIHIRRGDKTVVEDRKYEVQEYVDAFLQLNAKTKTVFLMSDDYRVYQEIKEGLPKCKIVTLVTPDQEGYEHPAIYFMSSDEKKREVIDWLTDIEIARKSSVFIGTFKSNIFKLIEFFKLSDCHDVSGFKKNMHGELL